MKAYPEKPLALGRVQATKPAAPPSKSERRVSMSLFSHAEAAGASKNRTGATTGAAPGVEETDLIRSGELTAREHHYAHESRCQDRKSRWFGGGTTTEDAVDRRMVIGIHVERSATGAQIPTG